MVKAYRYTSVFSVKCLKWRFLGLQYACNLRMQFMLYKLQSFLVCTWKGEGGLFQNKWGIIALLLPVAVYS